jgi:hypothetical protein
MSSYELILLLHIMLFCYWLGGDVGVFYSSNFVVNGDLSRETRLIAARIMLGCDLVPKVCMTLMLTVGGILTEFHGVYHSSWQMLLILLLGPFWLIMVLTIHFKHNAAYIPLLTKFDFYFRWVLVAAIILSTAYAVSVGRLEDNSWIAIKLLGFAFLVFCGLMIRINLSGFSTTYIKILESEYTQEDNQRMADSLKAVKPWVVTIWVVLVIEAALGIAKPDLF